MTKSSIMFCPECLSKYGKSFTYHFTGSMNRHRVKEHNFVIVKKTQK